MTKPDLRAFIARRFGPHWILQGQVKWRALMNEVARRCRAL